jgi:serine/threonine protein kinase
MSHVIPGGVPISSGVQAPVQVTPNGDEGHFQWKDGSRFDKCGQFPGGRYIAKKIIGSGTYGKVVECVDQKYGVETAIKLVRRGIPAFREAALKEIQILKELDGKCGTVKMLRSFEHEGHLCMSFDLLGQGVKSMLKRYVPI